MTGFLAEIMERTSLSPEKHLHGIQEGWRTEQGNSAFSCVSWITQDPDSLYVVPESGTSKAQLMGTPQMVIRPSACSLPSRDHRQHTPVFC
jgi:hypothetical protein